MIRGKTNHKQTNKKPNHPTKQTKPPVYRNHRGNFNRTSKQIWREKKIIHLKHAWTIAQQWSWKIFSMRNVDTTDISKPYICWENLILRILRIYIFCYHPGSRIMLTHNFITALGLELQIWEWALRCIFSHQGFRDSN